MPRKGSHFSPLQKGTLLSFCRTQSKQVHLFTSAEPILGVVTDSTSSAAWKFILSVIVNEVQLKLDTRADVRVIVKEMLKILKVAN